MDGAGINAASRHAPFHTHPLLGPFVVFDCAEGQERGGGGGSLCNRAEADLAAALYAGAEHKHLFWPQIGGGAICAKRSVLGTESSA